MQHNFTQNAEYSSWATPSPVIENNQSANMFSWILTIGDKNTNVCLNIYNQTNVPGLQIKILTIPMTKIECFLI